LAQARVRVVGVNGTKYLQAVETQPGGSLSVLQSFGDADNLENWLRANQFVNSYNSLRDLSQSQSRPQVGNNQDFFRAALAIFGVVLGAAIVASLLGED
jgi:hypothetical protein